MSIHRHGEIYTCHIIYGRDLDVQDCRNAIDLLPRSFAIAGIVTNPSRLPVSRLPMRQSSGSCSITIEFGGSGPMAMGYAAPDGFRDLASALLDTCVQNRRLGGFVTMGIEHLLDWALGDDWGHSIPWLAPPPISASFVTVTLSAPDNQNRAPGNYDPAIPSVIAEEMLSLISSHPDDSRARYPSSGNKVAYWQDRSKRMERGGTIPWWLVPVPQGSQDTIYQCDMDLGSPPTRDCSQVVENQLGAAVAASDTLTLTPGVNFFHANTCYLAISAAVAVVLSWAQVRTAVASLMDVCLHHPHGPAQGGRAYVGSQPKQVSGRKGKRTKKRQNGIPAGLNALPPHVNITMFEQLEPWTNPINELKSCTWQAVADGHPVSTCPKAKGA